MKNSRKILSTLMLAFFTVFTFVGCGGKELPEAKGYQWKVTKGDEEMYLIGTIHLTDPGYNYINENIKNMLNEYDGLGVEIDLTSDLVSEMSQEYSYLKDGDTIENYLTSEEVEKLKSICEETNIQYDSLKTLTPSTIMSNLELYFYIAAGSTAESVDLQLIRNTNLNKKEVIEIESAKDQFELLGELQDIESLKAIINSHEKNKFIEENKETADSTKKLIQAYINGDEAYMNEQATKMKELDENYYNKMLKDRNLGMVNKSEEIFNKEGTHIVAVGALHFFGEDGIVKLLEDRGYTVTRM